MDTSETYIKMCEKAEEIQKRKLIDGDFYYWTLTNRVHTSYAEQYSDYVVRHPEHWDYLRGRKVIWLPRQDQLQEIVEGDWVTTLYHFVCFVYGHFDPYDGMEHNVFTMEQLWLAFVMKEKYDKVWDGENWVKKK